MKKQVLGFWKMLRWIATRAVVFYVLIYFMTTSFVDFDQIKFGYKIRLLNKIIPKSYSLMIDLAQGKPLDDRARLKPYIKFYEKLVGFFPERADAFSVLAFCYYHNQEWQPAVSAYQQALDLNADVFWFHYNKGFILYKNKQFQDALKVFEGARGCELSSTVEFIKESKIVYRLIGVDDAVFFAQANQRLIQGREDVYFLSALIGYSLKRYDELLAMADLARSQGIQDADFWFYAGMAAFQMKNYDAASECFIFCLSRDQQNVKAWEILEQSARQSSSSVARKAKNLQRIKPKSGDVSITNKRVAARLADLNLQLF